MKPCLSTIISILWLLSSKFVVHDKYGCTFWFYLFSENQIYYKDWRLRTPLTLTLLTRRHPPYPLYLDKCCAIIVRSNPGKVITPFITFVDSIWTAWAFYYHKRNITAHGLGMDQTCLPPMEQICSQRSKSLKEHQFMLMQFHQIGDYTRGALSKL
jgi:hypothetical protein